MTRVEMYTTLTCSSCVRAKQLLARLGVTPVEIDVSFDRTEMVARSGRGTVPQIFIDDQLVGGYEDLLRLYNSGSLAALLGADTA